MKEAVVFLLDSSPSMNRPYPRATNTRDTASNTTTTRLDCAKQIVTTMVSDLMLQSSANEVCVIVLKTRETSHHKLAAAGCDLDEEQMDASVPFPNLTDLTNHGVTKPSADLLRKIQNVQSVSEQEASALRGDVCDGLILAADALYERTHGKKYQRQIVILTDAEHDIVVEDSQTLLVVDALRAMDCRLQVVGFDFLLSASYEQPMEASSLSLNTNAPKPAKTEPDTMSTKRLKKSTDYDSSETEDEDGFATCTQKTELDHNDPGQILYSTKEDREQLLSSLAEKTGGDVMAVSTLRQILQVDKGRSLKKATKRKIELRIAPGIVLPVRSLKMLSKETTLGMKKTAVIGTNKSDTYSTAGNDKAEMDDVRNVYMFVDPDHKDDVVEPQETIKAVRYGSDLIPMSSYDYEGLKSSANYIPYLEILGYTSRAAIPLVALIGPPYALSGSDSRKACAAISALAKSLEQLDRVAICTYMKTKGGDPILGGLFPLSEPQFKHAARLMFLQLPFAGDMKQLGGSVLLEDFIKPGIDHDKDAVCDDLVENLMLAPDTIQSGQVRSSFWRSWNQTKVKRVLNPSAPIVPIRTFDAADPMTTPAFTLDRSKPICERFRTRFALSEVNKKDSSTNKTAKNARQVLTYKDFLDS